MLKMPSAVVCLFVTVLIAGTALPLAGCRRLSNPFASKVASEQSEKPQDSSLNGMGIPEDERSFLSDESIQTVKELGSFSEDLEPAWIGKVKVRPDMQASNPAKTQYADFMTGAQIHDFQIQMIQAIQAAKRGKSPALGPNATGMRFERCDKGSTVLPSSTNPDDCGYLVENPKAGVTPQFEFYVLGTPGHMRQYIYVTTDVLQRPAVFSFNRPLPTNVALIYRPDSWQKVLLTVIVPAQNNFDPALSKYMGEKLLGKVWGLIGTGDHPRNLHDFTLQWEKQQFQKATILATTTAADLALILLSAGSASGVVAAWRTAGTAAGHVASKGLTSVAGKAAAQKFAQDFGWAILQSTLVGGSLYAGLHLDRLRTDVDSGPLKNALNVGFVLSQLTTLYDVGSLIRNSPKLVGNARKLLFEGELRAKFMSLVKGPKPKLTNDERVKYLGIVKKYWGLIVIKNPRAVHNTLAHADLDTFAADVKEKSKSALEEFKAMRAERALNRSREATTTTGKVATQESGEPQNLEELRDAARAALGRCDLPAPCLGLNGDASALSRDEIDSARADMQRRFDPESHENAPRDVKEILEELMRTVNESHSQLVRARR